MVHISHRHELRFRNLISNTNFLSGKERLELLQWMSDIKYMDHHDDLSNKRLLPGSGQWLLESQNFIEWQQSSTSSILWLHGIRKCPPYN